MPKQSFSFRYKHLGENEQRRLAHDEDRLLSTMLYNLIAFMLMMNVRKDLINSKVRSMLGKCRIAICYAEEITSLLCRLQNLVCKKIIQYSYASIFFLKF